MHLVFNGRQAFALADFLRDNMVEDSSEVLITDMGPDSIFVATDMSSVTINRDGEVTPA